MNKTRIATAIGAVALTLTVLSGCGHHGHITPRHSPTATPSPTIPSSAPTEPTRPTSPPPVSPTPSHTQTAPPIGAEERNAIRAAQQYLDGENFSRKSLIGQLAYEGYPTKDATSAVDSLVIDWDRQAVGSAKAYLKIEGFSRKGLVSQLEYDGFTTEQATYGVKGAGL